MPETGQIVLVDSFLGVPIDCSGRFAGCERMPAALRAAGLKQALPGAEDLGNLQVSLADPVRDPETGIIGYRDLLGATGVIRREVGAVLRSGWVPLISGGCCSLLIGTTAAVQDVFPGAGLAFIDGHLDCYTGQTSPTGEAADMELAILLGAGPRQLTGLTGGDRVIAPERVVVLGPRDAAQAAADGAPDPLEIAPGLHLTDYDELAELGPAAAGRRAAGLLGGADGTGRYWVHIDLDVLSVAAFPAVDYEQDAGLDWPELADLVRPLVTAPGFLGLNVTILNPTKDPAGTTAAATVRWLASVLAPPARQL